VLLVPYTLIAAYTDDENVKRTCIGSLVGEAELFKENLTEMAKPGPSKQLTIKNDHSIDVVPDEQLGL
jgi:hypothetical protein